MSIQWGRIQSGLLHTTMVVIKRRREKEEEIETDGGVRGLHPPVARCLVRPR